MSELRPFAEHFTVEDGQPRPRTRMAVQAHDADHLSAGERIADAAATAIGSWRFILIQTALVAAWVAVNVVGLAFGWDPYPFVLLNLMFSVQAAYTGPILLLASNRQAQKDREMAARDDEEIGLLLALNREQMTSHKQQTAMLRQLVGRKGQD